MSSFIAPSFWVLLGDPAAVFAGRRWWASCAPSSCAARNFEYVAAARALGVSNCDHHVAAPAAQRHGGDPDLHALHPRRLGRHAHLARFPRLRPAARLALAGRTAGAGQGQPPGAVARPSPASSPSRVMLTAAGLHRRSGARRLRSAEDVHDERPARPSANLHRRLPHGRAHHPCRARHLASTSTPARPLALVGESGSGKSVTACSILKLLPPSADVSSGSIRFKGQRPVAASEQRAARHPRQRHLDDLPGADELAQSAPHRRAAGRARSLVAAPRPAQGGGPRARRCELLDQVGIPIPRAASTTIRTSSPAASASA